MKKVILLLYAVSLSFSMKSQDQSSTVTTSGNIAFKETTKIEIKLEGDAARFADQLPKEQVSNRQLLFNTDFSLYQPAPDAQHEEEINQQGGTMIRMINGGENDKIFCDLKNKKKTEQKEFMTRMFLVDGDMKTQEWKIGGNFQTIMGYNCQEAVNTDTTRKVVAWFAPVIPVSSGPAGFGGLPGMILKLDINDGKRVIVATSIGQSLPADELIKPKDGKKVTDEEFRKIVDEKRKEMGDQNGEGGNHIIIRYKNN